MDQKLKIRDLTNDDWADWQRLWAGYLTFYETSRPPEHFEMLFDRLLSGEDHQFKCLIAEVDGTTAGLAHYLHHAHCWSVARVTYLQDLFVDPTVRGGGVGRKLIEALYAIADQAGAPSVYWLTKDHNTAARHLYDQLADVQDFVKYARPKG